ncbi:uncharacterized protein F5147DRAFT_654263 [Suillus discolor]|uniref:Uncharacterized protein n=1 Tax=Suillus discolor TaxID=1912936 RepID=A0A9P7JSH9_9AGAM|nr:uncharacterized protein F5147DRAFT_654263 [Suillus discolor]KAG2105081.1 hypothetical protein F5147DRAFT_654263 [Suillus discolor]
MLILVIQGLNGVAAGIVVVYDWVSTLGQEVRYHVLCNKWDNCYLECHVGRKMLMLLVIIFLAVNIACGVMAAIGLKDTVPEEFILSGTYMRGYAYGGDEQLLNSMVWMLNTVWEVLALCLSVWVAVKHFCELRRLGPSTESTIVDCFRVLVQSHVLYFASSVHVSFVGLSCLQLAHLSPEIVNSIPITAQILGGALESSTI